MIKKLLVANRGEIAVRVMRSCKELDIKTVAVFSDADRKAKHVRYADEAYYIGASPSSESYLRMDKIIEVAKRSGADAIHPGYGFLSENADFSQLCEDEGIIFIGPSPYAIHTMGDKITARQTMMAAGVPVVPGTKEKITSETRALEIIREIGFPVMIKASAGGGGKGMRMVKEEKELISAIRGARSEAKSAFGDDAVYIEKYISSPHHIEFQILADKLGHTIHLCERECSVQRRHQKVVEETPSPLMTAELREKMGKAAVAAAKAVNYYGAGTIEFLVDDDLNYYFLEMNTRLQVEHPITERVVGVDIVREQINIANGLPLTYQQEQIVQRGHSIECRIYAEDPDNNFMPSPGTIKEIVEPLGLGVRTDGYMYEGFEIPIFYDPMISKLIVWGESRHEAIARMKRALDEYKISGVKTSLAFLRSIMETPAFVDGKYNTHFIEENIEFLLSKRICDTHCEDIAMIAAFVEYLTKLKKIQPTTQFEVYTNKWKDVGRIKAAMRI
ncbi:MAG: acetyl-CoA carboxylase biotin carboxylase subunit [Bacteroidales bacterium]